jgi:putative sigma-54 modulation protein
MKLEIRREDVGISSEIQAHVERRLAFALGRFGGRIQRVAVYLADLNGPKGGVDKRCRLVARLGRAGTMIVEDRDADVTALIDRASERLASGIQRMLDRKRVSQSRRVDQPELARTRY